MNISAMFQTWIDAVTKPNEDNYYALAESPHAKSSTAALWVFIALFVGGFIGGLFGLVLPSSNPWGPVLELMKDAPPELRELLNNGGGNPGGFGAGLIGVICGVPFGALLGVIFFWIGTAIQNWIARMFGGVGELEKFFFVNAAYMAPIYLASNILSNIPLVGCISALLGFYSLYLNWLTIRTVHKIDGGKALLVLLIPSIIICILIICLTAVTFAVLGPVIGNVFEQINQGLVP